MLETVHPQRRALECREKSSLSPEELSVLQGDRRERRQVSVNAVSKANYQEVKTSAFS